ncbi:MAG: hypothetical protein KC994_04855 [Candidatus Omnitrophica bacterium]|nr:hypothetical protein [Candidatus Omnitrophota bacterium]
MSVSPRNESDPVIQVCEHCLYTYGWRQENEGPPPKRIASIRPPYPCPRCGYLQSLSQSRLKKRVQRNYFSWLAIVGVSILVFTTIGSGISYQWGIRPFGPIAVGGAILLIALGIWSGFLRYNLAADPNANLKRRRKLAQASLESGEVLSYQDLNKGRSDEKALPNPPPWSWEEAERRYASSSPETNLSKHVLRGFIYGLIPALICLASAKFYLDLTRAEWEYTNLYNGNQYERIQALEYLWSKGGEKEKDLVAQWFSSSRMTAQEADIYLIHLKPVRSYYYQKILNGILTMQTGVPGPQAWEVLKEQPDVVAQKVLEYLNKGAGDPARNLAILAKLDPQVLQETFEREIVVKPELIDKLGDFSTIMDKHWPVIAKGVLRSSEGDPRLRLNLIGSLLKVVPKGALDDMLHEALHSLGDWVVEPVANDPKRFFRVAILEPRPEWVETLFEGIASVTEEGVSLSKDAGDAIASLGTESIEKALDPMFGSAEEMRWLKLRILARHDPITAASQCHRMLENYLSRDWGDLTPQVLHEQAAEKEVLAKTAETLEGIPVDENWVGQCRIAYKIQDPDVRGQWALFLSHAKPELLLKAFSGAEGSAKEYRQWEVDALIESIAQNPDATLEEIAELLPRSQTEQDLHLSPVVKYALLDYLGKAGEVSIIPILKKMLDDESEVYLAPDGAGGEKKKVRLGAFTEEVIRNIEERSST